ncbi:MAG: GNAT family N-acetyltransferase [Candidatus Bathyarchaeales archaeon]
MSIEDIDFAVRITDTMNWNLTEQDFKFMMQLEPEGCFILMKDAEKIGVTTTVSFGIVGWIGNVIVDENYRRKGAGSTIVEYAINYLKGRGAKTIGLYSYKDKVDFYTQFGFKQDLEFTVLNGKAFSPHTKTTNIRKVGKTEMQKIVDFDSFYFGASREKLLEKIVNTEGNLGYHQIEDGEILGYVLAKVYDQYSEIGPLVCKMKNRKTAISLLTAVLNALVGRDVSLCLPKREEALINMLLNAGFKESFDVVRMFFGQLVFKDCIYIAESLERG